MFNDLEIELFSFGSGQHQDCPELLLALVLALQSCSGDLCYQHTVPFAPTVFPSISSHATALEEQVSHQKQHLKAAYHRVIDWFGLDGSLKIIWVQPPPMSQGPGVSFSLIPLFMSGPQLPLVALEEPWAQGCPAFHYKQAWHRSIL